MVHEFTGKNIHYVYFLCYALKDVTILEGSTTLRDRSTIINITFSDLIHLLARNALVAVVATHSFK